LKHAVTLELDDECAWLLEEIARFRNRTPDELVMTLLVEAGDASGIYHPSTPAGERQRPE
jgi:hypothetical protein